MVAAPAIGRLGDNRWGTYSLNQPVNNVLVPEKTDGLADLKTIQKASISPLTQIHQSTVENSEVVNPGFAGTPISKFEDLRLNRSSRGSSRSSMRDYRSHDRTGARFPDKKGDHSSMFSLVPMGRSDSEIDVSGDERPHAGGTEKPEEFEESYEYNYEDAFLKHPDLASAMSVLDFMKKELGEEMEHMDRNLLEIPSMGFGASRPTTRTHQKVLDMKTLLLRQEENNQPNTAHSSIEHFASLLEHAVKIQHESIASQWTQIRLRFSSKAETAKGTTNVTCRAGILGSINRHKDTFRQELEEPQGSTLTKENVGTYLYDLWHEPGFQTHTTQLHYAPEIKTEEECEDEPIPTLHSPDMLSMAQNAMMTRV